MPIKRSLGSESEYPSRENGVLRLYSMRYCPYVKRTSLILEHKNIPHETVYIDLANKPKWYLQKINCLGLVPSIENDDVIIFDSGIINEYLDAVYPGDKLIPSDPYQAAKDKMLLEIWSKVVTAYYKVFYPSGKEEEAVKEMLAALDLIEKELETRNTKFFGGDKPMMVDFNIWPHMERVSLFDLMVPDFKLDEERFKLVAAWIDRMTRVPAAEKTKLPLDNFKLFLGSVKRKDMDCDAGLEENTAAKRPRLEQNGAHGKA